MSTSPRRPLAVLAVLALTCCLALWAPPRARAAEPSVVLTPKQGGVGGTVTVTGRGWPPGALLTVLVCGQNGIGGTTACANADGLAGRADERGRITLRLPVAEPPRPCPCVVRVADVTGEDAAVVDVPFTVAGHPVAEPPKEPPARLTALRVRLDGSGGLLEWFGAPPERTVVVTVANLGSTPAVTPVFRVGTAHSVFAPDWRDVRWDGTLPPGREREVRLPVELAAGAHGDYAVSVEYGGELLAEQPWTVPRPWGVTLFLVLLCVVVPAALFRIGLLIVNRVRPGRPAAAAPVPAPVSSSSKG
ncbi:hypothetical protein GCM10027168_33260 [Streptomyces capparidis]